MRHLPAIRKRTLPSRQAGFTLLELIVVVSMIGILAALAIPNLIQMPRRAKEAVLKNNLHTIRQVLDQFNGDQGRFPSSVDELVEEGYLRYVPMDPFTGERTWEEVFEEPSFNDDLDDFDDFGDDFGESGPGVVDVHSLSDELSLEGDPYSGW